MPPAWMPASSLHTWLDSSVGDNVAAGRIHQPSAVPAVPYRSSGVLRSLNLAGFRQHSGARRSDETMRKGSSEAGADEVRTGMPGPIPG